VKKLAGQHEDGKPGMASYPSLKGGPAGYVCNASPDNAGHAWRGHCLQTKAGAPGGLTPGFTWGNHASLH
jgi:hypothetical protein